MTDNYDRQVTVTTTEDQITYAVYDPKDGTRFSITYPRGVTEAHAFMTINSMQPSYSLEPAP